MELLRAQLKSQDFIQQAMKVEEGRTLGGHQLNKPICVKHLEEFLIPTSSSNGIGYPHQNFTSPYWSTRPYVVCLQPLCCELFIQALIWPRQDAKCTQLGAFVLPAHSTGNVFSQTPQGFFPSHPFEICLMTVNTPTLLHPNTPLPFPCFIFLHSNPQHLICSMFHVLICLIAYLPMDKTWDVSS